MRKPTDFFVYDEELEDMNLVKEFLEKKGITWSLAECYIVWESFSGEYCAQFMSVGDELLEQFWEWLNV